MKYMEISDIGKTMNINQDTTLAINNGEYGLFAVADGMGGHSNGELASRYIIKMLQGWWLSFDASYYQHDFMKMVNAVGDTLRKANSDVYHLYNRSGICGSTMVVLFVSKDAYGLFYAGDSRLYIQYNNSFKQVTNDETWENQSDLQESERKRRWDELNGCLVNAVGIREELQCRVKTDMVRPGMVFLLCSDGLYKFCPVTNLQKCLHIERYGNLELCCRSLLESVYQTKANDNISFIVIQV